IDEAEGPRNGDGDTSKDGQQDFQVTLPQALQRRVATRRWIARFPLQLQSSANDQVPWDYDDDHLTMCQPPPWPADRSTVAHMHPPHSNNSDGPVVLHTRRRSDRKARHGTDPAN